MEKACYFAFATIALNASGLFIAKSARTLRLSSIPLACIGKPLFPRILRYGPYVAACAVVTAGEFEYSFALRSGSYMIDRSGHNTKSLLRCFPINYGQRVTS